MENFKRKDNIFKKLTKMEQSSLLFAVIVLCIIMSILSPVFFTSENILNLLKQASLAGITALGIAIVMIMGEIDLSVGSMQAAIGCLIVYSIGITGNIIISIIICLLAGALMGFIHATIVTKMKVNSLIATLGTLAILRGIVLILTKAASIRNTNTSFEFIGTGYIWFIPVPLFIFAVLSAVIYYVTKHTTFGRYIYAVGGNQDAARLSGINVTKFKYFAFIIGGVFAAISAIILAARLNSGQPQAGVGFELMVVSAVILGGVSLAGGRGSVSGVLLGLLILSILDNGLILLNVSSFYQQIARGTVLILAVYFDEKRRASIQKKLLDSKISVC